MQKDIETFLAKKKYRWKRCRKICPKKPDDELKSEKITQLKAIIELWEQKLVNIYFADEAGRFAAAIFAYSFNSILVE